MAAVTYTHLVTSRPAPPNRRGHCHGEDNGNEHHLTEAAVMLAFAMHLFDSGATNVELHPDGEHAKRFEIRSWLFKQGFEFGDGRGKTDYGGTYTRNGQTLTVSLRPGLGDVVTKMGDKTVVAECKGGVINSKHSGVTSRLRSGLCEVVGLLLTREAKQERQIAVVPNVPVISKLGAKMASRAKMAGIEIALVDPNGTIKFLSD